MRASLNSGHYLYWAGYTSPDWPVLQLLHDVATSSEVAAASPPSLSLARGGGGVLLRVRAHPLSRGAEALTVSAAEGGALHAHVSAPPREGAANAAVVRAVARALGAPASACEVVRGVRDRDKVVSVKGVSLEAARRALAALELR